MKKSQYPITIGVPSVAVIGVSRAGKSSLLSRLIHNHVSANLNTVGTEQGQTTLIPTDYFLRSDNDSPDAVRLRVTLRVFGDGAPRLDCDAVFTALSYPLLTYADGKKNNAKGVPVSVLEEYVNSGSFTEDFLHAVNGAVRLGQLDTPEFRELAAAGARELLEAVKLRLKEVDSAVEKMKNDDEKKRVRRVALRDALRQCFDDLRKDPGSSASKLLVHTGAFTWGRLKTLLPDNLWTERSTSVELDMEEDADRQRLKDLLSPASPLSLIVEKYEIACAMSSGFSNSFTAARDAGENSWIDPKLPFRLILCDTAGLTQDTGGDISSIQNRLSAAVTKGCGAILLLMPNSVIEDLRLMILQSFRAKEPELKKDHIPVYLAIARADEVLTFKADIDEDEDAFRDEARTKWTALREQKNKWQADFKAVDARYITNQPKLGQAYIDDIKTADPELGGEVADAISREASFEYLYNIARNTQRSLFPQGSSKPIFVNLTHPAADECLIRLQAFSAEQVVAAAQELKKSAKKYYIQNRLHWNTAKAFWDHHRSYGDKFVSRAMQYGRIYVHIDGDVRQALGGLSIGALADPDQVDLGQIRLEDNRGHSSSLFERLGLPEDASEEEVKKALWQLFLNNFGAKTSVGFARVLTQAVRRISFKNEEDTVTSCYEKGCAADYNQGVEDVLAYYRGYFSSKTVAADIAGTLNDEFSRAFSWFFFAIYSEER